MEVSSPRHCHVLVLVSIFGERTAESFRGSFDTGDWWSDGYAETRLGSPQYRATCVTRREMTRTHPGLNRAWLPLCLIRKRIISFLENRDDQSTACLCMESRQSYGQKLSSRRTFVDPVPPRPLAPLSLLGTLPNVGACRRLRNGFLARSRDVEALHKIASSHGRLGDAAIPRTKKGEHWARISGNRTTSIFPPIEIRRLALPPLGINPCRQTNHAT